jgi:hypothetical protein
MKLRDDQSAVADSALETPRLAAVYLRTARLGKEHDWYCLGSDGAISTMPEEPPAENALSERALTRNPSLVLYRSMQGYGVYWGPDSSRDPEGELIGDGSGRALSYGAMAEFTALDDAVEFYNGLLRHWWLRRTDTTQAALPELATRAGLAASKIRFAPEERLHPQLLALLERWRREAPGGAMSAVLLNERPLIGVETPSLVQELASYLRHDLSRSNILRDPDLSPATPIAVVAQTVEPTRLEHVWRALTDEGNDVVQKGSWQPNGRQIAAPLHSRPAPAVVEERPETAAAGPRTPEESVLRRAETEDATPQAAVSRSSDDRERKPAPATLAWALAAAVVALGVLAAWALDLLGHPPHPK